MLRKKGQLNAPVIKLSEDSYAFGHRLYLTKSISFVGKGEGAEGVYSTLVGYDNPDVSNNAGAFYLEPTDDDQEFLFENLNFDHFAVYSNRKQMALTPTSMVSNTGIEIHGSNRKSGNVFVKDTNVKIEHCSFVGGGGNMVKVFGGRCEINNSYFNAKGSITCSTNFVQVGDWAGGNIGYCAIKVNSTKFEYNHSAVDYDYDGCAVYVFGVTTIEEVCDCVFSEVECTVYVQPYGGSPTLANGYADLGLTFHNNDLGEEGYIALPTGDYNKLSADDKAACHTHEGTHYYILEDGNEVWFEA